MDLSCPSLLMDKLTLDGTSDYGSRETSAEETIGGLCQVEFRGKHYVFNRRSLFNMYCCVWWLCVVCH